MPLLDSRACDRLYHVGANVPQDERIVLPGNLCAGYRRGHKDACQVCLQSVFQPLISLEPRTKEVAHPQPKAAAPGHRNWEGSLEEGLSSPFSCRVTLEDP